MTKCRMAAAMIAVGLTGVIVLQCLSNARLRDVNRLLSEQVAQLNQLRADREQSVKPQPRASQPLPEDQLRELLRLRGQVGILRRQLAEAAKAGETRNTERVQPQPQTDPVDQQRQLAMARLSYSKNWILAFSLYADQHQGQCPTNFDQAAAFLPDDAKSGTNLTTDDFEIVYHGSLSDLPTPGNLIVIRQKQAWQSADGGWRRAYGFADGHSEIHSAADGNFGPWEDQHSQKAKDSGQ